MIHILFKNVEMSHLIIELAIDLEIIYSVIIRTLNINITIHHESIVNYLHFFNICTELCHLRII